MELRAFAEQVLFSGDLGQKLWSPDSFSDHDPGAPLTGEVLPGRPANLPLLSDQEVPPSPTPASLKQESSRGLALHSFAHHELQALELMAVALLRWPRAPRGFRRGLAQIIRDEQRHFRLYTTHAETWGCGVGDVGVGHFFWDTVAHLKTPREFLAALSLTFEQANLDFAQYWKKAFAAVEDHRAVDILEEVYKDEVRHVRHGITWFSKLGGGREFSDHAGALHFPMSPGRAKGPLFNREGRLKAGLTESYVDELEISNVSRGRPPRVFVFNPNVEDELAGRPPRKAARAVEEDLSSLLMFLAHKEDVVVAKRPPLPTLKPLHRAGFAIPQFVDTLADLGDRKRGESKPWGWSPDAAKRLSGTWNPAWRSLYDKTWALQQRQVFSERHPNPCLLSADATVHTELPTVLAQLEQPGNWVIKTPFSTSGFGRTRVEGRPDKSRLGWIKGQLQAGPVIVERWVDRLLDFSVQVEVGSRIQVVGITRFWTNSSGNYLGAVAGKWNTGLSPAWLRLLHETQMPQLMKDAAHQVGEAAAALDYVGPLGIDCLVTGTPEGPRLQPILEVNPRTTMGRIALAIAERCASPAAWLMLSTKACREAGYNSFLELETAVQKEQPEFNSGGLRAGAVLTSSPTAERVVSLLVADRDMQALQSRLTRLGFSLPEEPDSPF